IGSGAATPVNVVNFSMSLLPKSFDWGNSPVAHQHAQDRNGRRSINPHGPQKYRELAFDRRNLAIDRGDLPIYLRDTVLHRREPPFKRGKFLSRCLRLILIDPGGFESGISFSQHQRHCGSLMNLAGLRRCGVVIAHTSSAPQSRWKQASGLAQKAFSELWGREAESYGMPITPPMIISCPSPCNPLISYPLTEIR